MLTHFVYADLAYAVVGETVPQLKRRHNMITNTIAPLRCAPIGMLQWACGKMKPIVTQGR